MGDREVSVVTKICVNEDGKHCPIKTINRRIICRVSGEFLKWDNGLWRVCSACLAAQKEAERMTRIPCILCQQYY